MIRFLVLAVLMTSAIAQADSRIGVMGSYVWNNPENDKFEDIDGSETESRGTFGVGVRALAGINDQFFVRTGAGIIQKKAQFEFSNPAVVDGDVEYSVTYLNIPATLYMKAAPTFGIFFGTALQAKLSDSCKGSTTPSGGSSTKCRVQDASSVVLPAILGFDWAVSENISLELSYEHALMNAVKDTKIHSALASIVYNFDQQ